MPRHLEASLPTRVRFLREPLFIEAGLLLAVDVDRRPRVRFLREPLFIEASSSGAGQVSLIQVRFLREPLFIEAERIAIDAATHTLAGAVPSGAALH